MLGTSRFFMGCEEYPDRFARADISLDPPAREFISDEDSLAFVAHQWGFASTAATIVSGAVAERIKVEAFATCTFFMVGIIYPIIAHAVWHADGWASISSSEYGAIDFAGSGAVHMTG
jgi:ammonia channel protein AmtB